MQRITPVLLAQLCAIFKQRTRPIVVIAATNKPEMIDSAFLQPGRFDKIFPVSLPDEQARSEILKLQLRERKNRISEEEIMRLCRKNWMATLALI
jgi:SpoVK/Ycf46/Vps4 family AAA+-type ATPase